MKSVYGQYTRKNQISRVLHKNISIEDAHQTTCRPNRSRSSRKSSMRVMNSSSAAKLPAMKATKLARCVSAGEGNCCRYFSAAL